MRALSSPTVMPDGLLQGLHTAPDATTLAQQLAQAVADQLRQAVARRGHALLVVSGGSTPVPFFEALSVCALPWSQVVVTLADDRWLPDTHPDSNARLVRAHLLQGAAAEARFVPLFNGASHPAQGLPALEAELARLPWPADVVILGMGADGHTASLFPHASELDEALAPEVSGRCVAVSAPQTPNVPVPRVSLNARTLLDTRQLMLHLTGEAKLTFLRQVAVACDVHAWPIALAVCQTAVPCAVFHA
ncbi:MAG: 6-phosphogluconolactonase [Aquabacterium sp.]|uniref:6-phosphogluconolactonase n=1 Tax=Aquabacterium sp. TaxID=1872578 RepID=UPI003BBAB3FB